MNRRNDRRVPVSILVPIKNEAANLQRCLGCAMERRDSCYRFTKHRRLDRACRETGGATVVQFFFNLMASGLRKRIGRWKICRSKTNGWFILDADEVLPPEAETEFARAIENAGGKSLGTGSIAISFSSEKNCGIRIIRTGTFVCFDMRAVATKKIDRSWRPGAATTKCTNTLSSRDQQRD